LVADANSSRSFAPATAAMTDDTIPLFSFPAVEGKKVQPRLMAAGFLRTAG